MSELQPSVATASSPSDDSSDPPIGGGGGAVATPDAVPVSLKEPTKATKKTPPAPRVSRCRTDPDARVMKMADDGFRPAYNLQFAVDVDTRLIVHRRARLRRAEEGRHRRDRRLASPDGH